jgi:TonB family protein
MTRASFYERNRTAFCLLASLCVFSIFFCDPQLRAMSQNAPQPDPAIAPEIKAAHGECSPGMSEISVIAAPGSTSVVATVKCGQEVNITGGRDGFYKVRTMDGKEGYISLWFVANTSAEQAIQMLTTSAFHRNHPSSVKDIVAYPICEDCHDPEYPPSARDKRYEGTVLLQAVIGIDGRLSDIQVVGLSNLKGEPVNPQNMDRAAIAKQENAVKAVKKWRFKPARRSDGTPVAIIAPIAVTFRLR